VHWDIETGKTEKYLWPCENVLVSHHAKPPLSAKRSKHVLALAVSSDGRYLASGGLDRHIHLWDVRSREHIQVVNDIHLSVLFCYFEIYLEGSLVGLVKKKMYLYAAFMMQHLLVLLSISIDEHPVLSMRS
jgi:WD40 repeat protein